MTSSDIERLDILKTWHLEQAKENHRLVKVARSPWTRERYTMLAAHHDDAARFLARIIMEARP